MELPQEPELETRERQGQYGEIVVEYTPASEAAWSRYLRERRFANIAIRSYNEENDITDVEGTTS